MAEQNIEHLARVACDAAGHNPDQPMDSDCVPADMADLAEDEAWKEFVPVVQAILSAQHREATHADIRRSFNS